LEKGFRVRARSGGERREGGSPASPQSGLVIVGCFRILRAERIAIPAGILGRVQGSIRRTDDVGRFLSVIGKEGNADGHGDLGQRSAQAAIPSRVTPGKTTANSSPPRRQALRKPAELLESARLLDGFLELLDEAIRYLAVAAAFQT
jgi:hypothetical protein